MSRIGIKKQKFFFLKTNSILRIISERIQSLHVFADFHGSNRTSSSCFSSRVTINRSAVFRRVSDKDFHVNFIAKKKSLTASLVFRLVRRDEFGSRQVQTGNDRRDVCEHPLHFVYLWRVIFENLKLLTLSTWHTRLKISSLTFQVFRTVIFMESRWQEKRNSILWKSDVSNSFNRIKVVLRSFDETTE